MADRAAAAGSGARRRRRSSCSAQRGGRSSSPAAESATRRPRRRARERSACRSSRPSPARAQSPTTRGSALGGLGSKGNPGANAIARDADVVLCVGTRLTDFATGSHSLFQHPDVRFVASTSTRATRHKLGALPIVADAREALAALAEAGDASPDEYRAEVEAARAGWLEQRRGLAVQVEGERMSQGQLILTLNEAARPGDTDHGRAARRPETS